MSTARHDCWKELQVSADQEELEELLWESKNEVVETACRSACDFVQKFSKYKTNSNTQGPMPVWNVQL